MCVVSKQTRAFLQQYLKLRSNAVAALKKTGPHPYPHKFHVTTSLIAFIEQYKGLEDGEHHSDVVSVAGGLLSLSLLPTSSLPFPHVDLMSLCISSLPLSPTPSFATLPPSLPSYLSQLVYVLRSTQLSLLHVFMGSHSRLPIVATFNVHCAVHVHKNWLNFVVTKSVAIGMGILFACVHKGNPVCSQVESMPRESQAPN